jgi:hypothetical protein
LELNFQTLEDRLRACALSWMVSWEGHLALTEFAYNNYHASIKMEPYETLYDRRCVSPGEKSLVGPDWIQETTEEMQRIH